MVIQFLRKQSSFFCVSGNSSVSWLHMVNGWNWKTTRKGFDATGYLQGAIEKSKGATTGCSILVGIIFTRFRNSKR